MHDPTPQDRVEMIRGAHASGVANNKFHLECADVLRCESNTIGEILDTCDAELTLLRRQRDALNLQKRGLMQRLLTGKIRVRTS